jgi:hypothetical protein
MSEQSRNAHPQQRWNTFQDCAIGAGFKFGVGFWMAGLLFSAVGAAAYFLAFIVAAMFVTLQSS